jgi:hypothetical protein
MAIVRGLAPLAVHPKCRAEDGGARFKPNGASRWNAEVETEREFALGGNFIAVMMEEIDDGPR